MFEVGKESEFSNALKNLLELDYDAVEAYTVAINRLENENYKFMLQKFREDHQNHIYQITEILKNHKETVPNSADFKQFLTKGRVVIAKVNGDKGIINAMIRNEEDTNIAYENMNNRHDVWEDAKNIIKSGLEDERRHKKWMDETYQQLEQEL